MLCMDDDRHHLKQSIAVGLEMAARNGQPTMPTTNPHCARDYPSLLLFFTAAPPRRRQLSTRYHTV